MNKIASQILPHMVLATLLISSACAQQEILLYSAQRYIDAKEWASAKNELDHLRATHKQKDAQARILFTYGYFYQVMADIDTANHNRWLDSASTYYRRVIKERPKYPAALRNLALIYDARNQSQAAISSLRRAIEQTDDPAYTLTLGDLYLRRDSYDSAYYFYKKALNKDASLQAAHERMAYLYNFKKVNHELIFEHCQQMVDSGLPELASTAMTDLIRRDYTDSLPNENVRALVWWLSLFGKKKTADDDLLHAIPAEWKNAVFKQLVNAWLEPKAIEKLEWWRFSKPLAITKTLRLEPRLVVTDALLLHGQQLIRDGKRSEGVAIYEATYRLISNGNAPLLLTQDSVPDAFFNAASSLGLAYTKYPDFDPNGEKFTRLENDLLYGKGDAYERRKTDAIVKFHTTLGLIYASKNQWEGGIASGIFQLERAVNYSPESKNTITLKKLLVDGYLATKQQQKAQSMLLSCARTYMNDDNLNFARQCFVRYDSLLGNRQTKEYRQLKNVLDFRKRLGALTATDLNAMEGLEKSVDSLISDTTALPSYFYKIQKFKILSDLGDKALQLSNNKAATYFHVRALDQAREVETLSNLRDVSRINSQQNTIEKTVQFENRPGKALPVLKVGATTEQYRWNLQQPGTKDNLEVKINNDAFVAGKVAEVINNQAPTSEDQKSRVMVDGNKNEVLIYAPATGDKNSGLQNEIKRSVKTEDPKMKIRTIKP